MAKDNGLKDSVALLSLVFDFLSKLDEKQLCDLLDNKTRLGIDVGIQIDDRIDALINEKLRAAINDKLTQKSDNSSKTSIKKTTNEKKEQSYDNDLDSVASKISRLSTVESITDYFAQNPLRIGAMKSLANKYFDVSGTKKMNNEELIKAVADIAVARKSGV